MAIRTPWAAYCLDSAAALFGALIENAAQERVNIGSDSDPKWELRYRLNDLLTPGFRLELGDGDDVDHLRDLDGVRFDEVGA